MASLQHIVNLELDKAVFENGYTELMQQTPKEVADELCEFSSEFTDTPEDMHDALVAAVKSYIDWFNSRPKDEVKRENDA